MKLRDKKPQPSNTYRCDRKGPDVIITYHLAYMLAAQATGEFETHREFGAWLFKKEGFIITDWKKLRFETWQDGNKKSLNITSKIIGTIGHSILKI